MKKLILIGFVAFFVATGCVKQPQPAPDVKPAEHTKPVVHNALNSLDYLGSYRVERKVYANQLRTIELLNKTAYRAQTAGGRMYTGNYSWDNTGNIIMLENVNGKAIRFFVGEGHLKQLEAATTKGRIFRKVNPLLRK